MKSKYNTGVPIDINLLSEEERKIAFHEWAEGSEALEELLNIGYEKGFLSQACCGGDTGRPYISYELENEYARKMAMYVAKQLVESGLNCKICFTHDFSETEEEYREMREHLIKTFPESFSEQNYSPTRTIENLSVYTKMENREQIFKMMAKYVREAQLEGIKLPESEDEIPSRNFDEPINKKEMINKVIKSSKVDILNVDIVDVISEIKGAQNLLLQNQSKTQQTLENEQEIGKLE